MSKLKKIGLIVFIVLVVLSATIAYFVVQINDNLEYLSEIPINDVDLGQVSDGTYLGQYEVFPVSVTVNVTVVEHEITDIVILVHNNGQGEPAEVIIDDVLAEQTLQVDTIAGATYSSKVILLAIQNALLSGVE